MCIDDDPAIAIALSLRLRAYNVRVTTAYFGSHGIWQAVTERPDVIITDLRMPQGQGADVIECLKGRADTSEIPVIVLTGCRDRENATRMRELGVDHYFYKPIPFEVLLDALAVYIPLENRAETSAAAL